LVFHHFNPVPISDKAIDNLRRALEKTQSLKELFDKTADLWKAFSSSVTALKRQIMSGKSHKQNMESDQEYAVSFNTYINKGDQGSLTNKIWKATKSMLSVLIPTSIRVIR